MTVTLIAVSNPVYIQDSPFLRAHAARCRAIHFGIDLRRFDAPVDDAVVAQWRAQYRGKSLILFVGRLRHYKGVDVLNEAMRQVENAQARVVGIGPMEAAWRQQAEAAGLLADAPLRRRMGAAGRRRIEDEFTVDVMLDRTLAFYEEALALPGR